jgi:hypothetical protein
MVMWLFPKVIAHGLDAAKAKRFPRLQNIARRPGLEPGPILRGLSSGSMADTFRNHEHR